MRDKGRQDPEEGGHTIQHQGKQEGVQWETKGDKTLGKTDTPSNKGKQEGVQWETKGDKTLSEEGGHTIQHQGGHLKKVLRTPNSTLFGEKNVKQLGLSQTKGNSPQVSGQTSNLKKQLLPPFHIQVSEPYSPWW